MKSPRAFLAFSSTVAILIASSPITANADPPDGATFSAIISDLRAVTVDEFDGPDGVGPDPAMWNVETGGGGWGNDEQQVFTDAPANIRTNGRGQLVMEAREDSGTITSSRMNTHGRVTLSDGVFAVRMRLPAGQGIHAGAWMLGETWREAGYPDCGEIDVVEIVNDPAMAHFTLHGPWEDGRVPGWQVGTDVPTIDLSADFHTYWVRKQPGRITFGIDEPALAMIRTADLPEGARWAQNQSFFALLSLSVGGLWPGAVAPGVLPQRMIVDWVRFYE